MLPGSERQRDKQGLMLNGGGVDGGSKEEQNTKAEGESVRERDEDDGVFIIVKKGCESEITEQKKCE